MQHLNFSAGATYALAERLHLYGGAGWASAIPWRRYFDSTGILGGNTGDYWIADDDRNSVNLSLGLTWSIRRSERSPLHFSLGAETQPRGVVLGVGVGF